MKRVIILILFYILSQICLPIPVIAQTINLEGDVWAPYVMDPEHGSKGFIVDIVEMVFKRAGYTINFKIVPWTRTLIEVENGKTDGAMGIYYSQANLHKFIVPSEEIGISVNKLFVKNETSWKYKDINSLEKITIGIISDYDYGDLNDYLRKCKQNNSSNIAEISGNEALEKNLRKLLSNRIDVLIEDEIVVNYFSQQLHLSQKIKVAGTIPPSNKVGVAFSSKNPKSQEFAKILSEGIIKLRKSGELKLILDKYYVKDWKTQ